MNVDEVAVRLREEPLPDAEQAMLKTADRAVAQAGRASRSRRRKVMGMGLVAAALLALSPPGQSLAESVGELVGIGEPATLPAKEFGDTISRGQPLVLATGTAPGGDRYEIVVGSAVFAERKGLPADAGGEKTCLTVDIPKEPSFGTVEFCVDPGDEEFLGSGDVLDGVNYADASGVLAPKARYVFSALLSPEIARVELSYENDEGERVQAPTDVGVVDERIRDLIGTDDSVAYMVGFVPDDGLGPFPSLRGGEPGQRSEPGVLGTIELTGYDAAGHEIASNHFGSRFSRQLSEILRLKRTSRRPEPSRNEQIAEIALCWRLAAKAHDVGWCKRAQKAAAADPSLAQAANELEVSEADGVFSVRLPGGRVIRAG